MCLVCAICGPKVKVMHGCVNNCMHGAFFSLHSRGIICLMLLRVCKNSIVVFFSIIKSLFLGGGLFFDPLTSRGFFFLQIHQSNLIASILNIN